jgi:hypothetical protein
MKYLVKNMTCRPVSILCNSGQSYHLPPKYEHEMSGIEIENNEFIKKLQNQQIIKLIPLASRNETAKPRMSNKSNKIESPPEDEITKNHS